MPELPEVETVKNHISPLLTGRKIIEARNLRENLRIKFPENIGARLCNREIKKLTRRAKYIFCHLDNDELLVMHLGMTGKIFILAGNEKRAEKHDHFVMSLDDGNILYFNDVRRFGLITLLENSVQQEHKLFKNLGVEPLSSEFDTKYLQDILKNREQKIKTAIMDQNLIVGVGNIYASEALFLAGIHPEKPAKLISKQKCKLLVSYIKKVLEEAIKQGGSTIKDFQTVNGESGYFQHSFKVYGRAGEECNNCAGKIEKKVIGGRSSFFCKNCQR